MPSEFVNESVAILERTPVVVDSLLRGLAEPWSRVNEGAETWSPFDVVGHYIHGEKTDWIPRIEIILTHGEQVPFTPFDRFAQFRDSQGKSMVQLLDEFKALRKESLKNFAALNIDDAKLKKTGMHPELGRVTLKNLIASWVVHDLNHLNQINRVMAKRYKKELGPWTVYLSIVQDKK